MPKYKGFLEVAVPGGGRTVREHRADATICAHCGRSPRTLYDYFDNDVPVGGRLPAFCNKSCAIGYRLEGDRRRLTEVDGAPQTVKATPVVSAKPARHAKRAPRLKLASPPKRTKPTPRRKAHLSAVG